MISETTDDDEYGNNWSVLSSHGGLVREVITSENSIELVQIASRLDSAMHDEISNDDDPFAKVKGLISDMITRSQEKASADDTQQINLRAFDPKLVVYFSSHSWSEVMNIYPFSHASNTIRYRETLNQCKTSFDACSLQPTNGAAGEYAGHLVIRKHQERIGQDLGMKSAHGTKPDSALTSHTDMKIKSRQSQGVT